MITVSDNGRADEIYRRVGDAALRRLARRAHMRRFSVAYHWGAAHFSALDQARFFLRFDRLVPRRRAPTRAGCCLDHARPALGLLPSLAEGRLQDLLQGRLAGTAPVSSCTRRRCSSAGTPASRWRCSPTATPRTPMAPRRCEGSPSGSSARGRRFRLWHLRRRRSAAAGPARPRTGVPARRRPPPRAGGAPRHRLRRAEQLTGHRLAGYCEPWALLLDPAARDLARAQRFLRRRGLGLVILDAYRPARASRRSCAGRSGAGTATSWARTSPAAAPTTPVAPWMPRWCASATAGGCGWGATTRSARRPHAQRDRARAAQSAQPRAGLQRFGFAGYWREWWHFEHRVGRPRYLDLALGC